MTTESSSKRPAALVALARMESPGAEAELNPAEQVYRDTRTFTLHHRVDDYIRDPGASLISSNYDLRGSGGVAPAAPDQA